MEAAVTAKQGLPRRVNAGPDAAPYTVGLSGPDFQSTNPATLDPDLRAAIRSIARSEHLLVGCDYDGTVSPIVADPNKARPLPQAVGTLRFLAQLPDTTVAVVSGRALRDLAAMSRLPYEVRLVGSHGAEFDLDSLDSLDTVSAARLDGLMAECTSITKGVVGTHLESKPSGVAVHVRNASRPDAQQVLDALHQRFDDDASIHLTTGKEVLELSVVAADKGSAMERLAGEADATATVFIGDDVTDEHVFERMTHSNDLTVKVGDGETLARFRVAGPEEVLKVLAALGAEREAWLAGADAVPIEDHALLADGTDLALLTPDGSISWMCHPGPDAPSIFAELLGDPEAGHFRVSPDHGGRPLSQTYVDETMTVVTRWAGLTVTDYLDSSHRHQPGLQTRLRLIRVISGSKPAVVSFAPRPQFGSMPTSLKASRYGVKLTGTSDALVLVAPGLDWEITRNGPFETATAHLDPADGDIVIELRAGTENMRPYRTSEPDRRELTHARWHAFVSRLALPDLYRKEVLRSALTLKALCHEPTGAILAAATTSLPEWIGGIRNWDYRYCWLRDAAMTANALTLLGSTSEADAFLGWLEQIFETTASPERVHPLYRLDGSILGPEAVVDTLPGYAGSRPVRIGNAAQGQVQLDVFGPILELVANAARVRGWVTARDLALANQCVEAVRRRWNEPDHGIWEERDQPRSHVHSRIMCWQTVDRALELIAMHDDFDRPDWHELRDEIRTDILTHGWNDAEQTFVAAYDHTYVDAAVLAVVTSGFLPPEDPRVASTIRAVESSLRDGPTVYRYRHDDGLPGTEGGMHLCTTWLIEAYALAGMHDEATNLLHQYVSCTGTTGLLPEMYNPGAEAGLGNHPQAYSHIGLIRGVLALQE